jgi:hypothetical protein
LGTKTMAPGVATRRASICARKGVATFLFFLDDFLVEVDLFGLDFFFDEPAGVALRRASMAARRGVGRVVLVPATTVAAAAAGEGAATKTTLVTPRLAPRLASI